MKTLKNLKADPGPDAPNLLGNVIHGHHTEVMPGRFRSFRLTARHLVCSTGPKNAVAIPLAEILNLMAQTEPGLKIQGK